MTMHRPPADPDRYILPWGVVPLVRVQALGALSDRMATSLLLLEQAESTNGTPASDKFTYPLVAGRWYIALNSDRSRASSVLG